MYNPPIGIKTMTSRLVEEVNKDTNERIVSAVLSYGIDVDKEELLRALRYDREQYEKGYAAGYYAALDEIVRCKDCKFWRKLESSLLGEVMCCIVQGSMNVQKKKDDFCSCAERRTE